MLASAKHNNGLKLYRPHDTAIFLSGRLETHDADDDRHAFLSAVVALVLHQVRKGVLLVRGTEQKTKTINGGQRGLAMMHMVQ